MSIVCTTAHDELETAIQHNLNSAVRSTQAWSPVPFPYFNIVGWADAEDVSNISAVLRPYQTRQATAVWFQLPSSQSERSKDRLLAHGLTLLDVRRCMAVDINAVSIPETDTHILRVQNEAQCWDWVKVQSSANGGFPPLVQQTYLELMMSTLNTDSPLHAFIAYKGIQPVACSLLHPGNGVAGIYQVGTIPEARRKGYGRAVTYASLQYAGQIGCQISILLATQMGGPMYEKMGFQDVLQSNVYLFSPS
jgi:GNAT superfamily N-acetyltransferase